jgi:hypothetical protein
MALKLVGNEMKAFCSDGLRFFFRTAVNRPEHVNRLKLWTEGFRGALS